MMFLVVFVGACIARPQAFVLYPALAAGASPRPTVAVEVNHTSVGVDAHIDPHAMDKDLAVTG